MTEAPEHTGGCLCGAVRYRGLLGESKTVTHCYCGMCRKVSGGAFLTWAEFPAKDFAFTKGQPRYFKSSDIAVRGFCGGCGCQFTYQYVPDLESISESIWVAVGSLDRPGDIAPTDHIFTDNQLPWLHSDDGLPRWPGQLPWLHSDDRLSR